ncbi:TrbG/VirB9 family P-type conjugative transfer protein [Aquidulcibacter sp.]|uniref:TrbG/VirB9 family P-type conjugative transfer protein n=1 Tax=Aquidulcibacter sp. TaxID=2052990 RepID=UPI0025C1343C|nr:TrbG/VirB9 family P-type conjugative transfer protein [Aquidulcibacter sp.]MCA3697735.1 TrbG/VirB9 family P-type conjugative transfer protein [Aquidulcibacter sp.]
MDTRRSIITGRATAYATGLALLLSLSLPLAMPSNAGAKARSSEAQNTVRAHSPKKAKSTKRRPHSRTAHVATRPAETSPPKVGPAAIRAANAEALAPSRADGFVNAAQVFGYEPGRVYEVWTAPMRITALSLEPGERIISTAAGDTERWMIGDTTSGEAETIQTHLLIKPYRAGLATNMVVTTNRRVYLLALKASGESEAFNAAVSWTHPLPQAPTSQVAVGHSEIEPKSKTPAPILKAHGPEAYRIRTGWRKPEWTPVSVHDDGRQTFITFPDTLGTTEAPPLFVLNEQGEAQLTNWRKQGNSYVIDRLFQKAELRLGGERPQIVKIERRGDLP